MKKLLCLTICLLCAGATYAQSAARPEWPQFHGPTRDNVSTETGLLKEWPAEGPKLLWTAEGLGKGFSSMSVADGRIYAAGKTAEGTFVFAFNMDGKLAWKAANGGAWEVPAGQSWARGNDGARATPTIDKGVAYHLSEMGRLTAYDAATGKEIWTMSLTERFAAKPPQWGYTESPLIDGNNVICCPGGGKAYMAALNKKTGETVWANTDIGESPGYCSTQLLEFGGVRQIVTMTAKSVIGVNADTGALLWKQPLENQRGINITNPVVIKDGFVFAASGYGKGSLMLKLTPKDKGIAAEKVWETKDLDCQHESVILLDGCLYGAGNVAKGWWCLDMKTGAPKYNAPGIGQGSVLLADGMFYCLSEKGTMALVKPSPTEFRIVSQFKAPRGGEGNHWSHPVVCDGRLYIRHADKLFAYDVKAK